MKNKKIIITVILVVFLVLVLIPQKTQIKGVETANQRKVLLELFTATWCGPCASSGHYADETYDYFGSNKVVLVRNQVWEDGLDTPETNSRRSFYGVNGVPTLYINGQYQYHPMNYSEYRAKINEILNKPVQVSITLDASTASGSQFINLNVEVKLIENINVENLNLVVALYEKQVNYTGSNKVPTHRFVIRDYIFDEIGSKINFINGTAKLNLPISLRQGSNPANFGIAAWVQDMKILEVLQTESSDIKVNSAITPPVVILPKNGNFVKDLPVLVKWIGDGDSYKIEISDKEDFSNIILSKETQQTEEQIDNLNNETTYFLHIKSEKGVSESAFSTAVSFTITNKNKPGAQFKNLNNGDLRGGTINTLVQDPVDPNIIYVGSEGGGVFKSVDGGKNWTAKNFGLGDLYIEYLDIDSYNTNRVFAGTSNGLFISEDGGNLWTFCGLSSYVQKIKFVRSTQELFALKSDNLYISSDLGKNFSSISPPDINNYDYYFRSFDVSANGSTIYLGVYSYNNSTSFVYKTNNKGVSWSKLNLSLDKYEWIDNIVIDPFNPNVIYIASNELYKSTDGGNTFSKLSLPQDYVSSITLDQQNTSRVVVVANGSAYLSNDSGYTWTSIKTDFEIGGPIKLFFDIQNKDKFYIGSYNGGLYSSIDGGKSFTGYNPGLNAVKVSKIIKTPDIVAMTSSGTFNLLNSRWQIMNGYSFSETDKIKQNPQNPSEIIVLSPIYWSKDGGKTWEYHKLGEWLYSYAFDVNFQDKTIFFIYQNNSKWYLGKADFYGNVTESYEIPSQKISWINQIYVDQANSNNIYLAVGARWNSTTRKYEGSGLLKSTDGGKTFQEYAFKEDGVTKIFTDTNNQDTLFTNTWDGLYKSIDKGANWKKVSPSEASALDFATDRKTIYAAFGKSLAISTDYGDTWTYIPWDYSINFSRPKINDILVDKDNPDTVYISTDGSGIYMYFIPNTQNFSIVSSAGVNGTISPSGTITVNSGDSQTFNINSDSGYRVKDVKVDGTSVGAVTTYMFENVTSDHTIEAIFEPITYSITASAGPGGSISPTGTITVNYGDSKTFTITPNSGYKIANVKVDGVSIGSISSYTFSNITSNHTISVIFEKEITQTVIILQIGNSNFSVNGVSQEIDPGRGTKPVIKNDRTLVPIRAIVEALGGMIRWEGTERKVTINFKGTVIELWIDNPQAKVNGVEEWIDADNHNVKPIIVNDRTMLPLRFVAESLGCDVGWDPDTRTITITYGG